MGVVASLFAGIAFGTALAHGNDQAAALASLALALVMVGYAVAELRR